MATDLNQQVEGIKHPYLNVGMIEGGTNTNVVPGRVSFKLDRRMIPEEDPALVEEAVRALIDNAAADTPGLRVKTRRMMLARAMLPSAPQARLARLLQTHAQNVLGVAVAQTGTPLYTDARLYSERGIPAVLYGAGPRTVRESNAKRADEHLMLADLRGATKVVARCLYELLSERDRGETD